MRLPISFDDASYFRDEFRGDLVVTTGVLYYFPHTNVAAEKRRKKLGAGDGIDFVAPPLLGTVGEVVAPFGLGKLAYARARLLLGKPTLNRPRLLGGRGAWPAGASCAELQRLLDARVAAERRRPAELSEYEFSLPRPLRFAAGDVRRPRLRLGRLSFETEYDTHDFIVGLRHQRLLAEALGEGGFI